MSKRRFGEFEFDTATGELRRGGELVRLQSQPAQVLAILVDHAGEIVTREALREAIWGSDTFVDFDKNLTFAIGQVRMALGDSADAPAFVRTLPKRGYQFVAPIDDVPNAQKPQAFRSGRWRWAAAAGIVLAAASVFWLYSGRRGPTSARTIAIVPFDNETGAPDLDRFAQNLTDAVVAELTAAGDGRYSVIGNAVALRAPRDRRDLRAIGASLNAGYIVIGQVQQSGGRVRILAHLIRLPEQTHLWVTRVEGALGDPLTVESDVARRISSEFSRKL
jgi:DNA-binding winged helix-turn-helix (wHTH) protein/TolB-like protein